MNFGAVLDDPVVAGDAAIQKAMLDIAADLLRADEPDVQFLIIHIRNIGTAAHGNVIARLRHLLDGGFLQAAFGQAKS